MINADLAAPENIYFTLFERDGFTCQYCGMVAKAKELVREHIVPSAAGGPFADYNLVTACRSCNGKKGSAIWLPNNIAVLAALNPTWAAYIQQNATTYESPPPFPKFSVHNIDPRIAKRLKQIAVDRDRTMSDVVTEALTQWIEQNGGWRNA